jgi:hypothetical protein
MVEKLIKDIKAVTSQLPDYISGTRPTISFICFTKILCEKDMMKEFLPHLEDDVKGGLESAIMVWLELKTRVASF